MAKGDVLVRMKADVSNYDANIAKARRQLENFLKDNLSLGGVLKQTQGALLATATRFASVTAAVGALGAAFMDNIATARKFEVSMSQLSSLTGMVGADLSKLKEYAIELGSSTTLSASQVADAFKMIGSQQPQLLASGEALKSVTKNAITLAEAAGIDLATAAQTLSTSINQMGGDSGNAERYINVLAAASQKGAGDIAWLGEAITKSGTTAKAVGTDYEELVANLEQLAKAGFDASTAGTALRSIIMNLEKQANNDFKPSVVGLTQAFENLGKANLSIVGYQEIAGKMFASQAKALADAAGEARDMTSAITGTNTAEEQAKTNTDNLEGSIKALSSAWEGFNLHLNSSNGLLRSSVDWLKDVVVWADKAVMGMEKYAKRKAELNNEGSGAGNTRVDRQINTLQNTSESRRASVMNQQIEKYWRYINEKEKEIQQTQNIKDVFAWETISKNNKLADLTKSRDAAKAMLSEYEQRAKALLPSGKSDAGGGKVTIPVEVETEEAKQSIKELQAKIKELRKLRDDAIDSRDFEARDDYNKQIKEIEAQIKSLRGTGRGGKNTPEYIPLEGSIDAQTKKVQGLQKAWRAAADDDSRERIKKQIDDAQLSLDYMTGKAVVAGSNSRAVGYTFGEMFDQQHLNDLNNVVVNLKTPLEALEGELKHLTQFRDSSMTGEQWRNRNRLVEAKQNEIDTYMGKGKAVDGLDLKKIGDKMQGLSGGLASLTGGLKQMGIEIPQEVDQVIGVIQGLSTIIQGVQSVIQIFSTSSQAANTIALTANTAALWAVAATNAIPLARGGIIPHAADGYFVPGNNFSGDITPIMANAGELVLNRAQQGNLASQLQGGGMGGWKLTTKLAGTDLLVLLERTLQKQGYGKLATWG